MFPVDREILPEHPGTAPLLPGTTDDLWEVPEIPAVALTQATTTGLGDL